ncbi:thioesterase family protein [Microbacterium sp. C7(2022)]|uniref:thioesterase family protein n=1 Tax=Microbacterium sp. C7(2022) TaxID=2992759 RepID=UPI00237AD7E2|nr:thioesterase family protein [Microbacterium sp. C7(2022)]MDE0545118.1 thioesterase family protein [Microbacterium sp. C7(2022)]
MTLSLTDAAAATYDARVTAYFDRIEPTVFDARSAVQGAWNTDEQHIAPALGLIGHVLEQDHASRRGDDVLSLARVSYDILGVLPIAPVEVTTRVLRAGRTIELLEATLSHAGRAAVIARAWFLQPGDSTASEGSALPSMPPREECPPWDGATVWPGECITTIEVRRRETAPGRAQAWLRPGLPLVAGESISDTARLLGILDFANGMTPRVPPTQLAFPNVDLTVHLFRAPRGEWIGFDTTVSFGDGGLGVTHTVLHDEVGPIGAHQQSLTVRPLAAPPT